jgi:diguanylate cyclase (GGDEF)-like protein
MERLTEEIDRAGYFNTRLSFLMIDIDNFKACNDRYGHLVGDAVLKGVADIMKKSLREIDIIGRYGGEEFSVIMPDTLKADALVAGERLRNTLKKSKIRAYDESINISISGGIASFPDDTGDLNQLIDRADQMLYKAKAEGKNSVKAYGSA